MNNINEIAFEMPKNRYNAIKVIGVGGGGSNAVEYMYLQDIKGVDFVICNTDAQALENSSIPNRIQLGASLTEGMGAGANPEVGARAAKESYKELEKLLSTNTKMVFITAGMGGGTGTGAAPIIAQIAKDLGLLTVGIVTMPFEFEGKSRTKQAQDGIKALRDNVDSLIVINNNKLRDVYGNLGYKSGFAKADEVLSTAAKGIAEVITHHYKQNIDLNDAKTVLSNSGTAIMGSVVAIGEERARKAIVGALDSPLLNDNKIKGAKNVLLLIVSGTDEVTIDEIGEINDHIRSEAGSDVNIIMGIGDDERIGEAIAVTIIATGFSTGQQNEITEIEPKKVIHILEDEQKVQFDLFSEDTLNTASKPTEERSNDSIENKVIHQLEDKDTPLLTPTTDFIKNIEVFYEEIGIVQEKNIVFDFSEEVIKDTDTDIIKTTENILNSEVVYDEIVVDVEKDNEYIINMEEEVVEEASIKDNYLKQTELIFDFPIAEEETYIEKVEETSIEQKENTTKTVHNLFETEEEILESKTLVSEEVQEDVDLQFELKTLDDKEKAVNELQLGSNDYNQEISPLNASIADFKKTAEARKMHLKKYNYTFHKNPSNIDDIEKEPAYKRQNIELEDNPPSSENNQSRTTIDFNKDGIQITRNNSFLDDNVD
jgi:cell division protein FtsZ